MLEMILSPRKANRHPWEMFFIGLVYASAAILIVWWVFSSDPVLIKYSGILVVTFTVMFCLPFIYYAIKNEEERDVEGKGFVRILKEHSNVLLVFLFLFIGILVAFSIWYMVLGSDHYFKAQIETYCQINQPGNFDGCVSQYSIQNAKTTGYVTSKDRIFGIFANNIYVLIFTIVFSLIFGAGAIFILAWNASVIAAAIGVFSRYQLSCLPLGISKYMLHGVLEIAAYFIAALAGGIIGIAVIKHDTKTEKFWSILQDSLNLVIIAVVILFIAAIIEVFVTPYFFSGSC